MAADDPVETETPVFTEQEVFIIVGYVTLKLGIEDRDRVLALTTEAIPAVLSRDE